MVKTLERDRYALCEKHVIVPFCCSYQVYRYLAGCFGLISCRHYLAVYENELRRKDLPEGQREEILNEMSRIATVSANASVESRIFQSEQLDREHKLSRWIIGGLILLIGGGVGGVAWASRRA